MIGCHWQGYSYLAASGSEVNTCGRKCLKINQGSHHCYPDKSVTDLLFYRDKKVFLYQF